MFYRILRDAVCYWKTLVLIFFGPLIAWLFAVVLQWIGGQMKESAFCCTIVAVLMAIYWFTEVLPLAVTALLPLFLFPFFGILPASKVAPNYLQDSNFVFVGSLIMAVAVEESNLHKRLALKILVAMGSNPRWLLLGFQLSTAFLSLWMSNTATTAMMLPIALAVIEQLERFRRGSERRRLEFGSASFDMDEPTSRVHVDAPDDEPSERTRRVYKAFLLSICYSANIGGTGTLTGTGSNIVLVGQLESVNQTAVTFASWMAFSTPPMLICLALSWLWLQAYFIGFQRQQSGANVKLLLQQKSNELGSIRFQEGATLGLFITMILLWLLRKPNFIPGWGVLFEHNSKSFMSDGASAVFVACLLFVFPRQLPDWICTRHRGALERPTRWVARRAADLDADPVVRAPLLTWDAMQRKFPWGTVLLVGGGYALADGVFSGLAVWLGERVHGLAALPHVVFVLVSVVTVTFITEFSSNVTTASVFIPIIISVADATNTNTLYFVLPVAIACSFAFMLPVATPPNAIVFSAGLLRVKDMMLAGFVMNVLCIAVTMINIHTWGWWLFDFGNVPNSSLPQSLITSTMSATQLIQ